MAQLRDLIVQGVTRIIGKLVTTETQIQKLDAPLGAGSSSFGLGTSGQVLKTNGSSIYWGTDNDTSVTTVDNHYTPVASAGAEISAAISGTAGTYAKDTEYTVLTGIKAQRDAKGHVTGITYTAQKIKDTNNTYTIPTAGNAGTAVATTAANGTATTWARSDHVHSISSATIKSALGYTPYNATNPNGYTTNTGTVTSIKINTTAPLTGGSTTAVSTSGSWTIAIASQSPNLIMAGPSNGTNAAAANFRALVPADLPSFSKSKINDFSHDHGHITNGGVITESTAATSGDYLIISDISDSSRIKRGLALDSSTTSFLRNDGTWATPPGTAHTLKIETSTGTSSITLAASSKYKLTAGGSTYIFTTPPNTWTAMGGATSVANGTAGYVPAPPSNGYNTKFLRADGTWSSVTQSNVGLGNVENTKLSTWTGSSKITTLGTITTGTVPYANTSGVASSGHTHKYAGSSTAGGAATTALALTTNAGSTSVPVYFTDGKPSEITNLYIDGTATVTGKVTLQNVMNSVMTGGAFTAGHSDTATSPTTYYPAKWTFNKSIASIASGDIVYIQIPGAGISYGDYLSLDNGSHYYPVIYNTNTRLTTQFPSGAFIGLIYQATGAAAAIYPVNGSSATFTYSGGVWRLLNLYDANTTYSVITAAEIGNSAQATGRLITGARFYAGMASYTVSPTTTPTLVWGATATIATIAGKALKVTMPANPNSDTNVTQTVTTTNSTYPVLFTTTANQTATSTTGARFGTTVKINPSSGTVIATTFSGNLKGTIDSTTTGTTLSHDDMCKLKAGTGTGTLIATNAAVANIMCPVITNLTANAATTLASTDIGRMFQTNGSGVATIKIPYGTTIPAGADFLFAVYAANSTIQFTAASTSTVIRTPSGYSKSMSTQFNVCGLVKRNATNTGTEQWYLFGALD